MDLRVLRYFLAVAREGNITRAAELVHVTQPTISRQLKELEDEIGKKLFIRTNHSVKLTEAGLRLRQRAEDIVGLVDKTKKEFQALDDLTGGDIYIGGAETEAVKYIARTAKDLQSRYPNLRYHLYSGNYDDATERLDKGLLDFGLVVDPVDLSKYNYLTMPSKDIWGLVMRKDSSLATKKSIKVSDLLQVPLIFSSQALRQSAAPNHFSEWFGGAWDRLNIVTTYSLGFNAFIMVKEGLGYAISFDRIASTGEDSELTFRPLKPRLEAGLHLIWKKYQIFSPVADIFLKEIKARYSLG